MSIIDYIKDMAALAMNGEGQGIMFFAAMYGVAMGIYSLIFQMRINAWPGTLGALVKDKLTKFGALEPQRGNQTYVTDALYTYQVEDQEYQGKRVSPWVIVASHNARFVLVQQLKSISRLPGGMVEVYYNPGNPKKSFLIRPGIKSQFVTILLTSVPLAFYLAIYA